MPNGLSSMLWFVAIIVMIPVALWLFKRTPMGGATANVFMRHVAVLPISQNQRIVTVEVGTGEERRWLVLGVTAQSITTLHVLMPGADTPPPIAPLVPPQAFAQLMNKFRGTAGDASDKKGASGDR
jgi:flagellar protein FliO/FliZ